ncbi:MAG TPA: CcmD family protein [Candidatus Binataceae bacterium]|nr:CcmD family protein [Candidatus Binataceae bacterium]
MEHLGFLFAAYAIIFSVIFVYVVFLWRRQAALDAEVSALEARLHALKDAASKSEASPRPK